MGNPNNDFQPPPPYQQHSGDYASYPQLNEQERQEADQLWGTPVMGAPSNPNAHPDNQHAAMGHLGGSGRSGSGSIHAQAQACQSQSGPSVSAQAPGGSPYVQGSSSPGTTTGGQGAREKLRTQVAVYSKQAEKVMNKWWGHLSTGPSMADNAWGRVTAGTAFLKKGGFEGVFKSTFPAEANEKLKKTYACFLSTSTGPVGGTLYISTKKLAFCSDRSLSYTAEGGQTAYSYYKVIIPIHKLAAVNPSTNQSKPTEKYIQIVTKDSYEFWFMGFVNYDKGVQNLQAALGPDNQPVGGSASFSQSGSASFSQAYSPNEQPYSPNQQPYPPNQEPYPPNQEPYPPNQQPYPPNQNTQQDYIPPNHYGTPH